MDNKTIFIKTGKGEDEIKSKTNHLYGDIKRTLGLIDNKSKVEQLTKRAAPSLRDSISDMLQQLVDGGFIAEEVKPSSGLKIPPPKISTPRMVKPVAQAETKKEEELDFTGSAGTSHAVTSVVEAGLPQAQHAKSESEAKAKQEAKARTAEEARLLEAARARMEQAAVQAKAKEELEVKARAEAIAAQHKAEREAARYRVEMAVAKAKEKAEAEAKARADAEAARLKAEQEAAKIRAARAEAEAKARAEMELARLKAERAQARILAVREAAQAREKVEAEARVRAEAARIKVEQEAARAKAELAALQAQAQVEAQAKAQAEAKARAEIEAARLKAEREQARVEVELGAAQAKEKAEAEAKAQAEIMESVQQANASSQEQISVGSKPIPKVDDPKVDDKERKLTEAQSKIWASAEQRAKTQAASQAKQTEIKPVAQQVVKIPQSETVVQRAAKKRGKPLPWGKAVAGLFALLLLSAFLLPYVWPMQEYVNKIEQKLSAQLQQPVQVGNLHVTLLPQPKLELQDVAVGGNKELMAHKVTLFFDFATLLSESKVISSAEIDDLILNSQAFEASLPLLQKAGMNAGYPLARMTLQRARISGVNLGLPIANGVVDFDGQGHILKAVLRSEDGKQRMEIQPLQSRWQIALSIKEGSLPMLPDIIFKELNVNGEVNADAANFHEIDGDVYGGHLAGSARLTWQNGWQMQGRLNVKALDLHAALPQIGVAGELDGDVNFILRGTQPQLMAKAPHLDGKLVIKKGLINKIDMVEIATMQYRQGTPGGRTSFDELSGTLLVDRNSQHLRQIKISAGVMSANGYIDVAPDKKLAGRLNVDLKMRAEMGSVPLSLSGTLSEPVWRAGR